MHAVITAGLVSTITLFSPPEKPLTSERIQELVKKLEEPTRLTTDTREGPPDYPWPTFNYRWHHAEMAELKLAGEAAVPTLFALLEDKSKPGQARAHAANLLLKRVVGTKVKPDQRTIDAINAALQGKDPALCYGALNWLGSHGLADMIENWNILKNSSEVYWKGWLPPEERSFSPIVMDAFLPKVVALLADEHPEIVCSAARVIGKFGQPKIGVPELIAALKRKEAEIHGSAAAILGRVGKGDPSVLKALLDQLNPKDSILTYASFIYAIGTFGPEAKSAVPQIIDALKDDRKDIHRKEDLLHDAAAFALGAIGPDAKAAIPVLRECLSTKLYDADPIGTMYYRGQRELVLAALDSIEPAVGKKARADEKQHYEEYRKWHAEITKPTAPVIPPGIRP